MCFAIPGKIIRVRGDTADVDFLGQEKQISMKFLKARVGDYIITAGNVAADVIPADRAEALIDAFLKSKREMNGG